MLRLEFLVATICPVVKLGMVPCKVGKCLPRQINLAQSQQHGHQITAGASHW